MKKGFHLFKNLFSLDYTERVRFFSFRYPRISVILIHVIFWEVAFFLLSLLLHFFGGGVSLLFGITHPAYDWFSGTTAALIYGVLTGIIYLQLKKSWVNKMSVGMRLIAEGFTYTIAFVITSLSVFFAWRDQRLEAFEALGLQSAGMDYLRYLTAAIFIYTFSLNFLLGFFMQMRSKFGPGVLFPLLLGKYRKPQIDYRVFMFMDLRSSTTYAERLGHLKYSELIQDCFYIVNRLVPKYYAEIFQYVGDEVVLTWQENRLIDHNNCIRFYYHFMDELQKKNEYFTGKYGFVPEFKAGIHNGVITAIEVGDIKREIAFHGDTINTAARIQSVCNKYNRSLLISESMYENVVAGNEFKILFVDDVRLKGKNRALSLYAVERLDEGGH